WLMKNAGDADCFYLCDQDDIWRDHKLEHAVKVLEDINSDIPAVYLSEFTWCDGEMNPIRMNEAYKKHHSLEKYITLGDRNAFGFTMHFNKTALDAVKGADCIDKGCSHDETTYLYCLLKGTTIWGNISDADYRRHGGNAANVDLKGGNIVSHFLWRISYFLFQNHKKETYQRFYYFYKSFQNQLTEHEKNVFKLYLGKKGKLKKAVMGGRYRDNLFDEISIRILFLLGKI
ncbi:MAG: hypothetical protein IJH60_05310, partial [Eubacterium sp.]|nr:hypothetical protein [Eubacterium sp.]